MNIEFTEADIAAFLNYTAPTEPYEDDDDESEGESQPVGEPAVQAEGATEPTIVAEVALLQEPTTPEDAPPQGESQVAAPPPGEPATRQITNIEFTEADIAAFLNYTAPTEPYDENDEDDDDSEAGSPPETQNTAEAEPESGEGFQAENVPEGPAADQRVNIEFTAADIAALLNYSAPVEPYDEDDEGDDESEGDGQLEAQCFAETGLEQTEDPAGEVGPIENQNTNIEFTASDIAAFLNYTAPTEPYDEDDEDDSDSEEDCQSRVQVTSEAGPEPGAGFTDETEAIGPLAGQRVNIEFTEADIAALLNYSATAEPYDEDDDDEDDSEEGDSLRIAVEETERRVEPTCNTEVGSSSRTQVLEISKTEDVEIRREEPIVPGAASECSDLTRRESTDIVFTGADIAAFLNYEAPQEPYDYDDDDDSEPGAEEGESGENAGLDTTHDVSGPSEDRSMNIEFTAADIAALLNYTAPPDLYDEDDDDDSDDISLSAVSGAHLTPAAVNQFRGSHEAGPSEPEIKEVAPEMEIKPEAVVDLGEPEGADSTSEAGSEGIEEEVEVEKENPASPRNLKSWADLFLDEDDEGESLPEVGTREHDDVEPDILSCCQKIEEGSDAKCLVSLMKSMPSLNKVECQANCIRECINYAVGNDGNFSDNDKMNILNTYFKVRHDVLASHALNVLKQKQEATDVSFRGKFGINSNRTPDFILNAKEGYVIIEVAAVSDPERAYRSKGDVNKGYTPKYEKEIELLRAQGLVIHYSVLVFNVSQPNDQDHIHEMQSIAELLGVDITASKEHLMNLEIIRKEFITQNSYIFDLYSHFLNLLFGSNYELAEGLDGEELELFGEPIKPYTGKYKRVAVSSNLFDRVSSIMPRLGTMLDRYARDDRADSRYNLVFENTSSTFRFEKTAKPKFGETYNEWMVNINNDSKAWVCSCLIVKIGGEVVAKPKADFEFFSYEEGKDLNIELDCQQWFNTSHRWDFHKGSAEFLNFTKRLDTRRLLDKECKYEDEGLEERIIESIMDLDQEHGNYESYLKMVNSLNYKPLCSKIVDNKMFLNAKEKFDSAMSSTLDSESPKIFWVKPPFIYPIAQISVNDYDSYNSKPTILESLVLKDLGPYTNKVVSICSGQSFVFGTKSVEVNENYGACRAKLAEYQREVTGMLKAVAKEKGLKRLPKLVDLEDSDAIKGKLKSLNKDLESSAKLNGVINKNLGLIKMGRSKNLLSKDFQYEMEHFKTKKSKSHYKGVGNDYNPNVVKNVFETLKQALFSVTDGLCPDILYDDTAAKDNNLLFQLKKDALDQCRGYYTALRSTHMYHACCFISRLCHTLMFHSQTPMNSSYVVPDNLGYNNVLLLVRGGKKIFATKKSKLFRLVVPTFTSSAKLYVDNNDRSSYTTFNTQDGRTYLVTPWANLHETVLADGLTMLHRLMGFVIMNHQPEMGIQENFDRVYFNLILAFHNRRQTEAMLHNMRYIFMNCMSEVAAVDEILPELAGFNYDYFQAWVRLKISENFVPFARKMKEIHDSSSNGKIGSFQKYKLIHPFNGHEIRDVNTLALGIYSSYLMSKAPTTQTLEQVRNLKSMMVVHEEFEAEVKDVTNTYKSLGYDFASYSEELHECDFNFDPSYCFLLGRFMGDYIKNLEKESKLIQKWDSVLDVNWDNMANTKGLRGDDGDFFGNKGYYVVYKEVLKNKENMERVISLLEGDKDGVDVEKELKEMNESYRKRIKMKSLEGVVFHVVDKVQRGGGREIFVMDRETKVHQQVIEDYTKYLCKLVPNEMISIPSNRRLSTIHSKVFEDVRDQDEKYYWVLDCRKWAPKSMIEKFIIFLMGAKHVLPPTFVTHAINFFKMLRRKRIYTRPHVVEILSGSQATEKYRKYFVMDPKRKAYYFEMRYSWVMGIFNYFSSLVHVAAQLHASHIIRITSQKSFAADTILHMVAHSDDSAGKLLAKDKFHLIRASYIYETLMHASNHLLSKKKCNQGKMYYEFISILYIGGVLLSLLAKFTGMFSFHPTDKGYCSDITDAYSKCIELLLNGATFTQGYIAMKIQANLIYKFYFGDNIPSEYYGLPPSLFGVPDAHPLMILICGSDADLFRIMQNYDDDQSLVLFNINKMMLPLGSDQEGFLKALKCSPNVKLSKKLLELKSMVRIPDIFSEAWTLKNVKFKHTYLNALQFLKQLEDKSFIAALQDESLTRRLSRAYYFRSNLTVGTSRGLMKPREARELIFLIKKAVQGDVTDIKGDIGSILLDAADDLEDEGGHDCFKRAFDFIFTEVRSLDAYLDKMRYTPDMVVDYPKTNKPVYVTLQKTLEECPVDYNPQSLCSWIKEPEYRHLLPDTRGYHTAVLFLKKVLESKDLMIEDMPIEHLFIILQKMKSKSKVEYFCYSNMPSQVREISTYQDVLSFLAHNSFHAKYIQGLSIQYGKTINMPMENITTDLDDDDLQYTLSLVVLANAVMSSNDYTPDMLELEYEAPKFLKGKIMTFKSLLIKAMKYWVGKHRVYPYVKCIFQCCQQLMQGNNVFEGSVLKGTYYHSYIKRQMLVDNVWLGQGKLFISLGQLLLVFIIVNTRVTKAVVQVMDYFFQSTEVGYINLCLREGSLPFLQENMTTTSVEDWEKSCLGLDKGGNYYIGLARNSVKHLDITFDSNLSTPLTEVGLGRVRNFKGSRLIWEAYFDEVKYSYYINTLPIEVQNSVMLLRGSLRESLHNKRILKKDTSARNIMVEVCAKELDLERTVNFESVVKSYHMSDMYKVLKACQRLKLCTVNKPQLKITNHPAPDGGLLNSLISYAKHDDSFDFRWDRSLSPEYLALKSTQPEAFLTEFVETMRSKFDDLYTDIDKASIYKALENLGLDLNSNEAEEKMMNLLCTWGYAGVAGAMNVLGEVEDKSQFEKIRSYPQSTPYIGLFSGTFFDLLNAIFDTYKLHCNEEDFLVVECFDKGVRVTGRDLNMQRMSTVHAVVLDTFAKDVVDVWAYDDNLYIAHLMIKSIMNSAAARQTFKSLVDKFVLLKSLPINPNVCLEWQVAFRSLYDCYLLVENKGHELDYNIRRSLIVDKQNPYVITRDILAKAGVQVSATRLFHYGAISNYLYDLLKTNFRDTYKGKDVYFKVTMLSPEETASAKDVPYNISYFFKHRLSDEFIDSDDYEEVMYELQSDNPDLDLIKEVIEGAENVYDDVKRTSVKVSVNGRLTDMIKFDLKIYLAFGGNLTVQFYNKIRMIGEDVIIMTNKMPLRALLCKHSKVFKSKDRAWVNLTLLNPSMVYYLVYSRDLNDVNFWARTLNADPVTEAIRGKMMSENYLSYRNESGAIRNVDIEMQPGKQWENLQQHLDHVDEEEAKKLNKAGEKEEERKQTARDKIKEKLKSEGLDDDQLEKYLPELEGAEDEGLKGWERVFNLIASLSTNEVDGKMNYKNKLADKMAEMIRKPKSAREHEMIMQTPRIFGGGRRRGKAIKNTLFRERKIIAEIDSFCPGIIWNILAGTLYISQRTYDLVKNQINLYRMIMSGVKKHKPGKQFMLNLCMLILNDANVVNEPDGEHETWQTLLGATQKYMLMDEEEEEGEDWNFFAEDDEQGDLRYGIAGAAQ